MPHQAVAQIQALPETQLSETQLPETKQRRFSEYIADYVLTTDKTLRIGISRLLLSSIVYVVCSALTLYQQYTGITHYPQASILVVSCLLIPAFFYCLLRSGWTKRIADPSLTVTQIIVAQANIACAYAWTGSAHAGTLMLIPLILVFGAFTMSARSARNSTFYIISLMGCTIFYKTQTDPELYPAKVEWVYFIFVLVIVLIFLQLNNQLHYWRKSLKKQKQMLREKNGMLEAALQHINNLAMRDELTGLYNRRCMLEAIDRHIKHHVRTGTRFLLVMIDIDHFKTINDSYGHAIGDEVLREFAIKAAQSLRETDMICRWGGEEFLVLITEMTASNAILSIERLRNSFSSFQLCQTVPHLRINFSAGAAAYRTGEDISQVIDRADQALYKAKSSGRGCTVLES